MEKQVKTYEEFSGTKQVTPEKLAAYLAYLESISEKSEPKEHSNVWPYPKTK